MNRRNTTTATFVVVVAVLTVSSVAIGVVLSLWLLPMWASVALAATIAPVGLVLYLIIVGAFFVEATAPQGPWVHVTSRTALRQVVMPDDTIHLIAATPRSGPLFWPPQLRHHRLVFWSNGYPSAERIRRNFPNDNLDDLAAVVVIDPLIAGNVLRRRSDESIATIGDYTGPGALADAGSVAEKAHRASVGLEYLTRSEYAKKWRDDHGQPNP